jgi:hypothetical protein
MKTCFGKTAKPAATKSKAKRAAKKAQAEARRQVALARIRPPCDGPPVRRQDMKAIGSILAAAAFGVFAAQTASAQAPQSQYTSTKNKDCRTAEKNKPKEEMPWVVQSCKGAGGMVVRIFDVDLRQTVSFGKTLAAAAKEPAAEQGFGPFNHAHDVLEWRMRDGKPFATIQRWFIADNENPGPDGRPKNVQILAVTRLSPACHVAYIDANANADANVLAQQAADEKATAFTCGKDEIAIVGKRGRGAELAAP